MSTMTLLPCPWCGCELSSVSVSEGSTFHWRKVDGCCTDGPEVRHDTMANDQAAAEADSEERAIEAWNNRAHLAQPAQAVDAAMVERALTYRARLEDGAVWPDAYGAEEQAAEREQMWAMLSETLNPNGPKAYCRACQRAGMSNCGYFDECAGATCITCHRPFTDSKPARGGGHDDA